MKLFLAIISFASVMATASLADEVTEVVGDAMEAYADGDIKGAMSDLEFAVQLLSQMASAGLERYLPELQDGWEMELDRDSGAAMAMFGGGTFAKGIYTNDDGARFEIEIMAGGIMVSSMGALFGSTAMLASKGKLIRIQRQKFSVGDGEITGMVGDKVLIQITSSDVDEEVLLSHLKSIDLKALADF